MKTQDYHLLKALTGWRETELSQTKTPPSPKGSIYSLTDILNFLNNIDTISFDIFDTLLRRDVDPPDHSKRAAMQQLVFALNQEDIKANLSDLLILRHESESEARQEALIHGGDAECTITEIFSKLYIYIKEKYDIDISTHIDIDTLINFEVDTEMKRLSLMPGAEQLLKSLHKRKIRIILISDMYLELSHLYRILDHNGLLKFIDDIYVSSHTRLSKGSGNIYRHLIKNGVLVPNKSLHIGDHPVSDIQMANTHGLNALLYFNPDEYQRRTLLRQSLALAEKFGDTSALFKISGLFNKNESDITPREIAYRRLGPIFTLFALDLLHDALSNKYREIFFLARDGYLIQQLYQRLRIKLDLARLIPTPEGRYLYLSRASTRLAELDNSSEILSSLAQRVNRQGGILALIDILGLERSPYQLLMDKIIGKEIPENALDKNGSLQKKLLANQEFSDHLKSDIVKGRMQLYDYLVQEKLLAPGNVLLADIGWNGSILSTLENAFGDNPDFPNIHARFFGRLYGSAVDKINISPGFAYDEARNNPIEHIVNECRELFESVSSSCDGSVLGYQSVEQKILPRCAHSCLDESDKNLVHELQKGVLDYCDDFIDLYNRFAPLSDALQPNAIIEATSLIAGTRPAEQACIANLQFDLSWGTSSRVSLGEYLGFTGSRTPSNQLSNLALKIQLNDNLSCGMNLQGFFEKIHQMVERLHQENSLIFYGVGTVTSLIAPLLSDHIAYFVDGNSALHNQLFLDKPICSPDVLQKENAHTVFVTAINRKNVISKRLTSCHLPILYIDDLL